MLVALEVATTATGGPSGREIVADENAGEHHLPFVFVDKVISPPRVFAVSVVENTPVEKSVTDV